MKAKKSLGQNLEPSSFAKTSYGASFPKPKKSLGQNFLKSKSVVNDIVKAADVKAGDVILEIGPGKGILTEALLASDASRVIAVEKDDQLFEFLQGKFAEEIKDGRLELIHGDILQIQNLNLKNQNDNAKLKIKDRNYKIVANIPYYLTSRLFRQFLESDNQPSKMVLMIQKEVGYRILGNSEITNYKLQKPNKSQITNSKSKKGKKKGKESILSISVKAYGEPKIVKNVPAEMFSPKPKVDSVVLLVDNISKEFFLKNKINEQEFFKLVKTGFASKRKVLRNNLRYAKIADMELLSKMFKKCEISETARAENLSLDDWACLYKEIAN
jgi:16S rRNA (adenine1518-N6/adenine1519-N6)-dimethyltransferase